MKNLLLLFIFLFYTSSLYSQQITYKDSTIAEHFDNNLNEWDQSESSESATQIKDGQYIVEHKRTESSWAYWQTFQVDLKQDFSIEMKLTQLDGTDNYGYGLIWGFSDWDNYNTFLITANGYYYIGTTLQGNATELQPYKTEEKINGLNTPNTIKIEQIDNYVHFFINDKEVFQNHKSVFQKSGQYTGCLAYNKKKISIDELTIKGKFPSINFIKDPIKGYKRENLGDKVNSIYTDQGPLISTDQSILYFIRKKSPDNIGGADGGEDDAWYAEKNADGTWSAAKNMGTPINNNSNNFIVSMSADNNSIFVANTYNADGSSAGAGLSKSERTGNGWTVPVALKIDNYYNDAKVVDFFVSQDQQFIICAITRKDSRGELDLHVCKRNADGSYTEPVNLGSVVNTTGLEMSPFLASDNKTLYFSSNGHPGLGNNDIFLTRRLDDTWLNWSVPENLGPEINSRLWEGDFSIPASGEYAYMASYTNSIGKSDIIRVKLAATAKPNPVVLVKGKVLNKKTNEPLEATISYIDIETNKEVGKAISNPKTGQYNIILQVGKKYSFRANKENFYAINDFLDVSVLTEYTEKEKNLYLVPLEVGQTIRLNNIFFDFNKSALKPHSGEELDRLIKLLKDNPKMEIEISGHTDNVGADDYNLTLSQQRVESVLAYLKSKGIDASRLKGKGYGETKPIAPNTTEEGKATNRRVDFTILKN